MHLFKFISTKDSAYEALETLGGIEMVALVDLNTEEQAFNLPFQPAIKRATDTLRKLEYVEQQCKDNGILLKAPSHFSEFQAAREFLKDEFKCSKQNVIDEIEKRVGDQEDFLQEQNKHIKEMSENFGSLLEYKSVISKTAKMLSGERHKDEEMGGGMNVSLNHQIGIGHIAGVIKMTEADRMRQVLFRISRGNSLVNFIPFNSKQM